MLLEMAKHQEIRIMLVGGGTAGHIHPLFAVYSAVMSRQAHTRFTYIGEPGVYATKFIELKIPIKKIFSGKLHQDSPFQIPLDIFKLIVSFFQSLWHIFWEMPDMLFSKGGPGSIAPVIVARFFMIPVCIHESDSVPSITTKITAKFAKKIFLAFKETRDKLRGQDKKKCQIVGNPLRPFLLENFPDKRTAKISLGFHPDKPLLVIMGGSQGSRRINNLITVSLKQILELGIQVFHQTGTNLFGEVSGVLGHYFDSLEEMDIAGYHITDFFDQNILKEVFAAADVIVSRSGSSIFEFAALGKPSILIPFPEAAQNHQLQNALIYEQTGACILLEEHEITVRRFIDFLEPLITELDLLEQMSNSAKSFAKPDAAYKIAEELLKLIHR